MATTNPNKQPAKTAAPVVTAPVNPIDTILAVTAADAAKPEAPVEQPKVEAPVEQPKVEAPVEQPKVEAPVEQPKAEAPVEQPKAEAPVEQPKAEAPVEQPGPASDAAAAVEMSQNPTNASQGVQLPEPAVEVASEFEPAVEVASEFEPAVEVASELVDMVTVTVPKGFKLRIDNHREIPIAPGVQEMERSWAEHWYAKANGVTVYAPEKR